MTLEPTKNTACGTGLRWDNATTPTPDHYCYVCKHIHYTDPWDDRAPAKKRLAKRNPDHYLKGI